MRASRPTRRCALRLELRSAVTVALLVLACGCGATQSSRGSPIAALRAAAAAAPKDPEAQRKLAFAEAFSYEGDPASVDAALQRALALAPASPRLLFLRAIWRDTHGQPAEALDAYLKALQVATGSSDPLAPVLAEIEAVSIAGLEGAVRGYDAKVSAVLSTLVDDPRLSTPARYQVTALLGKLAYRRGERARAQAWAQKAGCVTSLRAAGPFGPRQLLGFDQAHAARPGSVLAASYDLGPGSGVQLTRELGARGCSVNLGGGPIADGGSSYAQAFVELPRKGRYLVRLESPNSSELFVDGRSVLRLDRRAELLPDVAFLPLELSAGRHELMVKVSTRHPNPVFSLAVGPERARDAQALALPFADDSALGFEKYLRAALALGRGDVFAARTTLHGVRAGGRASGLLLSLRAGLMLSDPLYPSELREDEARQLYETAAARDAELWSPKLQLAGMMAGNGRSKEAIAALRQAVARHPEVPALGLALSSLLRGEGWDAEADAVLAKVRARLPDACGPLAAELEALRDRHREQAAAELVEPLMKCEAQGNARYALLLRQRRFTEARAELERLAALEPPQSRYPWIVARLELAKNRGDDAAVAQHIAELRAQYPRSQSGAVEELDRLAGRGEIPQALAHAQRALAELPASMAGLQRLLPVLGGKHELAPYRVDGATVIGRFEASGRKYEAPQVLVWDYMAVRLFEDGSSIELVHSIQKAQSDEAVDELGEVTVPDGAQVLTLHTIKPDGQRLEPDEIEGKDTVSLPTVAPGDYVELEYLRYQEPSQGFPAGYSGDRFYFTSFEIPFDHSEMVVILPANMEAKVDPRGPAPALREERRDGVRVWRFSVDESRALKPEPGAVSAREYLPSVRIGVRASWPSFVESIRDVLIDRDLPDPDLQRVVREVVGDAPPSDPLERARRLYAFVLEQIENSDDMFSQAASMVRAKSGNRARVLHYLLGLAGVRSQLVLVRSAGADATPSDMADGDTYDNLLVLVEGGRAPVWLFTAERHAAFGYLPPLLRGQPALALRPGSPRLQTPPAEPGQSLRKLTYDVTLRPDGGASVRAVETVFGSGAVGWRSELESVPGAELEHRFEQDYLSRLVPGARLSALTIEGRDEARDSLTLEYDFEVSALGRRVGEQWALPPVLATALAHNFAQLATRTTDALIGSPMELEVTLRIKLPQGAGRPILPRPVQLTAAIPGRPRFEMSVRQSGDQLLVERRLDLPLMRVRSKDYAAFASFCRMVDEAEGKELLFRLP